MTLNRRDAIRLLATSVALPVVSAFMPLAPGPRPMHRIVRFEKAGNRERGRWVKVRMSKLKNGDRFKILTMDDGKQEYTAEGDAYWVEEHKVWGIDGLAV